MKGKVQKMKRRVLLLILLLMCCGSIVACADFEGALEKQENSTDNKDDKADLDGYVEGVNKITIGDVNNDDKEDAIVIDKSMISLMSGTKVIQKFEPDSNFEYKKVNAIVNDVDNDGENEIIVMASIGGNAPVYCLYLLNMVEQKYSLVEFPNEISTLTTNTGIDAQVIPKEFLKYEIKGKDFLFTIDVSRSYGVSTMAEQQYRQLTERWEEILKEKEEGKISGVVRTEVITNNDGKKVVRIYEMINDADKNYVGALVIDIAFDVDGEYQIINYGLFEHSILMP